MVTVFKAMNQAQKRRWPIFERISTLSSVFEIVPKGPALTASSSHKISENRRKSLKRERLHKKLNDYKLDFEVMKQENSQDTFFHVFWIQRFSNCKEWNIYCWILWISCLFMITACSKLIESWLHLSKPHKLLLISSEKITMISRDL